MLRQLHRILLAMLFVVSTGQLPAATKVDSLRQKMQHQKGKELLESYRQLFEYYYYSDDPDNVWKVCEEQAQEAERQGNIEIASNARFNKIVLYYDLKFYEQVVAKAPAEISWQEKHQQWVNCIDTWFMLADSYVNVGKLQTALHEVKEMISLAQQTDNNYMLAAAYGMMSYIYSNIDVDESIAASRKSINLLLKEKTILLNGQLSLSYYNLMNAQKKKKDYVGLLATCSEWKKVLDRYSKEGEQYGLQYADCMLFKVDALIALKHYDEAEEAIRQAREYSRQEFQDGDAKSASICYYIAWLAMERGNLSKALAYSDSVMASTVVSLDEDYLTQRADIMQRIGRANESTNIYRRLYESKDSLFSREMRMQLDEMNTLLKVDELKMESRLERSRFTILIIALIAIALVILTIVRQRAHKKLVRAYDQLEETTTAKERIESELRIARDIQMSMVPHQFPAAPGLDLYASMTAAREVGGDLYDYLLSGNDLYFCVGDVSGKGVPASLFMAQAIRLFRALAKQKQKPAQIANRLNDELSENNDSGMFVTMFIGLVNLQSGHLDFCNAGHNPPVVGGDEHGGTFLQVEPNAPIGLWPGLEYQGEEIENVKNRPLFLYTDGLNEAENPEKQLFGDDRLLEVLRETRYVSSRQVIERLQSAVEEHRDGAEPNDDLTMLCLKIESEKQEPKGYE